MTIPVPPRLPEEVTSALPDTVPELKRVLAEVRGRIVQHRDTFDMRLARYIEDRIAHLEASQTAASKQ